MKRLVGSLIVAVMALSMGSCSSSDSAGYNVYESTQTYFSSMSALNVEVAYEPAAAPFTGNGFAQPLWNFLKSNLSALFQGRALVPAISIPTSLSQMLALPSQNKTTWTNQEIFDFAAAQRQGITTATTGDFFILFLEGYLDDGSGNPNTSVLGVQLTGTTVIAIFKPVVTSSSAGQPAYVGKYVEQATLVHEMGHALGLVNNGLPMASSHQDTAHGAHCTNPNCSMYWQNEGAAAARQFVQNVVTTGNEVIYGSECLKDAHSYQP